jgi:hypothetical protein
VAAIEVCPIAESLIDKVLDISRANLNFSIAWRWQTNPLQAPVSLGRVSH